MNSPPEKTDAALDSERYVRAMELVISNLLRIGVITSVAFVVVGTVLTFVHHPGYISSSADFQQLKAPGGDFPRSLAEVLAGVRQLRGQAVVILGLLLLIATPVLRVLVSIFAFIYQRDRIFTLITAIVFGLLMLSFVLGRAD